MNIINILLPMNLINPYPSHLGWETKITINKFQDSPSLFSKFMFIRGSTILSR